MKISYNWLRELLDIDLTVEELSRKLTFSGIEVESIATIGEYLNQFIVGEVLTCDKHPEADKLSVCDVFDGIDTHKVVCGAPNVSSGQKIAFAPIGTQLPGLTIKKAKIRGIESSGMICSEKELGLSENHEGILVLNNAAMLGQKLGEHFNVVDTVLDVEITPNRPDLLGMLGIAQELCASSNQKKPIDLQHNIESAKQIPSHMPQIDDTDLCTRYIATKINNVKIKSSPDWLINRLNAAGVKPINNVVDVTNYVMLLYGHPLHAFDANFLKGDKIIIRKSNLGEELPALDNNTYKLTGNELVISDIEKPIALAGIIGGKNSHITDETTEIILEAACFDSSIIRQTSYNFKISTDSSYRFERGMADATCHDISIVASNLIIQLAGGFIDSFTDVYPNPKDKRIVSLRPDRARKLLAIDIDNKTIINYLDSKAVHLKSDMSEEQASTLYFTIPHNRVDLVKEIDLIEEIIRIHGFDKVPETKEIKPIMDINFFNIKRGMKNTLVNNGFYEAVNISFADPQTLDMMNLKEDDYRRNAVKIINPQGESFSIMRTSFLPGLLKNVLLNLNFGVESIKLFELNKVFFNSATTLEKYRLTGVMAGKYNPLYWKEKIENVNFYDIRGIDSTIFGYLGIKNVHLKLSNEPFYMPGGGVDCFQFDNLLGSMGRIDTKVLEQFGIESDVYMFDFDLDMIFSLASFKFAKYEDISKFPTVSRDLSFVISEEYKIDEIINTITHVNPKIIKNVMPFDQYKGKNIEEGYRSLSINISLVSEIKTLTDEQIKKIMSSIVEKLSEKYKIKMR